MKMTKELILLFFTFSMAKKYEKCMPEIDDRHYCGLINSYSTLQHVLQFTYLGYKTLNLTLKCDLSEDRSNEAVYYKTDGNFYIHYAKKHCVDYKTVPTFQVQNDNYFNERSCCDLGQYLDFATKRCVKVESFPLKNSLQRKFNRYGKYLNNSWLEDKWKNRAMIDYKINLSDFQTNQNKIKAILPKNMKYIINTIQENEHYCIARTNKTVLLRVTKDSDCNVNECISKCILMKKSPARVTWHKYNSTSTNDIKNALLQESEISLLGNLTCPDKFQRVQSSWLLQNQGDLVLSDQNVKLKKDEYCFSVENEEVVAYTCSSKINNAKQQLPTSQADECETNTCLAMCSDYNPKGMNLTEVSLQKKYIYLNDTFIDHNKNKLLQSKETTLRRSFNCLDGYKKLPYKWSIVDHGNLNIPEFDIFVARYDYCLNFETEVFPYVCESKLNEIREQIRVSQMNECKKNPCIRKCGDFDEEMMTVAVHKFNTAETGVNDVLSNLPNTSLEENFNCPNGYEILQRKWSMTNQADLNISEYNLLIKNEDYCFMDENGEITVYMCKSTFDQLEGNIAEYEMKECEIDTCIRECDISNDEIMGVILYKPTSVDTNAKSVFETAKKLSIKNQFECPEGYEILQQTWSLSSQNDLIVSRYNITVKADKYCFKEQNGMIDVYACASTISQIKNAIQEREINECKVNTCIRKCGNFEKGDMNVYMHKYSQAENSSVRDTLLRESDLSLEEAFNCSDGYEMLQQKWSITSQGNLILSDYDVVINNGDYCFGMGDEGVYVYLCKNTNEVIEEYISRSEDDANENTNNFVLIGSSAAAASVVSLFSIFILYKRWKKRKKDNSELRRNVMQSSI